MLCLLEAPSPECSDEAPEREKCAALSPTISCVTMVSGPSSIIEEKPKMKHGDEYIASTFTHICMHLPYIYTHVYICFQHIYNTYIYMCAYT